MNIAIIGVGNLGKRHLEATLNSDLAKNVYCVDTDERVQELCDSYCNEERTVSFSTKIEDLPKELEVVVMATSAGVRRMLFEKLIQQSNVKNIVFEKVLFQKIEDYYFVKEKLDELGIKAWVNCARREWDSYHELKREVDKCNEFEVHISGGNWGLGCNGVHMLDLVNFFEGAGLCEITNLLLDEDVMDSKRSGYKEINGTIIGKGQRCKLFSVSCYKDSTLPISIDISGDRFRCSISESNQKIVYSSVENQWHYEEKPFGIWYQSQLTNKVIESIVNTGDCRLAKYDESMKIHLSYIEPLIDYFEKKGMEKGICPIT